MLEDVFGTINHVTWWQECVRAALIFAYGLLAVRLAGRRLFGKWSALDIVVSIVVGSNLSRAMTGNAPLWGTLAATGLLMGLHWILSHAVALWPRLSHALEGRPIRLGENGRVEHSLRVRHAISEADLCQALRGSGLEEPSGARLIVLEPSGNVSVLKASSNQ